MAAKKSPISTIRKNYLIYKKERKEKHQELYDKICNIVQQDQFFFLDTDVLLSCKVLIKSSGIENPFHTNYNNDITQEIVLCNRESLHLHTQESWVCIMPSEWKLTGGFFIEEPTFFSNFFYLSSIMDDDFDVFNSNYSESLSFMGDRINNHCINYYIVAKGSHYIALLKSMLLQNTNP
jgi:hypothetical protein